MKTQLKPYALTEMELRLVVKALCNANEVIQKTMDGACLVIVSDAISLLDSIYATETSRVRDAKLREGRKGKCG